MRRLFSILCSKYAGEEDGCLPHLYMYYYRREALFPTLPGGTVLVRGRRLNGSNGAFERHSDGALKLIQMGRQSMEEHTIVNPRSHCAAIMRHQQRHLEEVFKDDQPHSLVTLISMTQRMSRRRPLIKCQVGSKLQVTKS
jgi:hypothetical protein